MALAPVAVAPAPLAAASEPQAVAVGKPLSEAPPAPPGIGPAPVNEFPQVKASAGREKAIAPAAAATPASEAARSRRRESKLSFQRLMRMKSA